MRSLCHKAQICTFGPNHLWFKTNWEWCVGEKPKDTMRKSTEMTHFYSVVTENKTVVSWLPGNTSRYLNVGVSSKERLFL